ncbi:MAG: replicative DNA helicase [Pseudomonadota bacterium]
MIPFPSLEREPIEAVEAEQGLLGAILVKPDLLDTISDYLEPHHFSRPGHGVIYHACQSLRKHSQVGDPITVRDFIANDWERAPIADASTGKEEALKYLKALVASVVSIANAPFYARRIVDLWLLRTLVDACVRAIDRAYTPDVDDGPDKQIETLESDLYSLAIAETDPDGWALPFDKVADLSVRQAEAARNKERDLIGVPTGFADIDYCLGGLQPSDLIIIGARPGMGKTALATNIACHAARLCKESSTREGAVVVFFSLEMSALQLGTRVLSGLAQVRSDDIRAGRINREDMDRLVEGRDILGSMPLFIDDTAALSVSALRRRALRLKRQHDVGLIIIDYLQLLSSEQGKRRSENRVQELAEMTRGLKILAKDVDVPVIVLSQLSRAVEQRDDKRPQLADLRDSGTIEQDADVVMFVYRAAYYHEKKEPRLGDDSSTEEVVAHELWQNKMNSIRNEALVSIAKHRHGATAMVPLHFDGRYAQFSNLERKNPWQREA